MTSPFASVSWLGAAAGALAYFALGAAWFTPLFGHAWDRAVGVARTPAARFGPLYYGMPLVGSVLPAIAAGVLVAALDLTEVTDAITLGLVLGIGIAAAVSFTNAVMPTVPRPLLLGAVTGGYHVVGCVLATVLAVLLR